MIDNEICRLLCLTLGKYTGTENIHFYPSCNVIKYVVDSDKFLISISYEPVDALYTINIEILHNNSLHDVVFLTKSRKYHYDVKKCLSNLGLSKKRFYDNVYAFCVIICQYLDAHSDLHGFAGLYPSDMTFDGIFL